MDLDLEEALSAPFQDRDWFTKLAILCLLGIVPVLGAPIALNGYMVAVVRGVEAGETRTLPDWQRFENVLLDGLRLSVIGLIYALPLYLLCGVPLVVLVATRLAGEAPVRNPFELFAGPTGAAVLAFMCLAMLYGLALALVWPAVVVLYSRRPRVSTGFLPGAIVRFMRARPATYLATVVLVFLVGVVISFAMFVVNFVPFVGLIAFPIAAALIILFTAELYGQLARAMAAPAPAPA